jgi:hypothetical protein
VLLFSGNKSIKQPAVSQLREHCFIGGKPPNPRVGFAEVWAAMIRTFLLKKENIIRRI